MKTKIFFILFLVWNKAFFRYIESLRNLHMSIFDVWRCYTPSSWLTPATFEYYNREYFKWLNQLWRDKLLGGNEL